MPPETLTPGQEAVVGAILVIVGLGLVPVAVAMARHLFPQRVVFFARWGFSHVILGLFTFFVVATVVALSGIGSGPLDALFLMLVPHAAAGLFILIVARRRHPDLVPALGLETSGSLRAIAAGLSVFLLLLPGLFGCMLLWPWLFELLGGVFAPQEVLLAFLDLEGSELIWACVLAVLVVPFFEELLFRGFLQPLLSQNFGEQGGIVLTSAFFAAMHGAAAFLPIFALSWMLGAIMVRTHRLVAPWAVHAAFNALNLVLLLGIPETRELLT